MAEGTDITMMDGSVSFSGGVNSIKSPTVQTERNPLGLTRNDLAWLNNATVRDSGITQRAGWQPISTILSGPAIFQGAFMYEPDGANPYLVVAIGGHIYQVLCEDPFTVTDLTAAFPANVPQFNPATEAQAFFAQGEEFLVIQAGDNATLPFIWDGATLRRSNGITNVVGGQPGQTWTLTPTAFWVIPPVGNTVVVPLTVGYPGVVLDVGTYGVVGTFEVSVVAGLNITLTTIASEYIGQKLGLPGAPVPFVVNPAPAPANINEIPAATAMDYYMGRLWYAQDRTVSAGDIVGGPSGTAAYDFRDSILRVTENPLVIGGDGFAMPAQEGNVRAIKHGGAIDVAMGQGRLFIFTRKAVFSLQVPVSRDDWIAADSQNAPSLTIVQLVNGSVNDRSVVTVNGDLFYQSLEPGIRSLLQAVRSFEQWGNVDISSNVKRVLQFNDRSLMHASSGIVFDNRMWQTVLPYESDNGIAHRAIVAMDFVPISGFGVNRIPVWEGVLEGLDIHQLTVGDFGGRERAYAVVSSREDNSLQCWELTDYSRTDNGDNRVTWQIEFPAYNWGNEFMLKKLVSAELWIDRLYGEVEFTMEYRPDGQTCWNPWHRWHVCSSRNSMEDCANPTSYPTQEYGECYRSTMTLPLPPDQCAECSTGRPANIGYQFQPRLTLKGYCRVRGIMLHAEPVMRKLYEGMTC